MLHMEIGQDRPTGLKRYIIAQKYEQMTRASVKGSLGVIYS